MASTLRVALACFRSEPCDPQLNFHRHANWAAKAAARGAHLVLFPETSLTGYVQKPAAAIPLRSRWLSEVERLARRHAMHLCVGFVERRADQFHNTQLLVGPRGRLGVMRKINLTDIERRFFTPGGPLPLFNVRGVKVGIAICADATHYETPKALSLRGAQVILSPHAGYLRHTPQSWLAWRRSRWPLIAHDCAAYLLGCNQAGRRSAGDSETDLGFASGAAAFDPDGRCFAFSRIRTNREALLICDVDPARAKQARVGRFSLEQLEAGVFYHPRICRS